MRKVWVLIAMAAAAAAASDQNYKAATTRSGSYVHIPAGETVKGGLAVYGAVVVIDGAVDGDLMAFGADVRVNGSVSGNCLICAASAALPGNVSGNADLYGAVVDVPGEIGGNLKVGSAAAYLRGAVAGATEVHAAASWLGGTFARPVTADADYLALEDSAALAGDLNYRASKLDRAPGAAVGGKIKILPPPARKEKPKGFNAGWWIVKNIWSMLALVAVAFLLNLFRPPLLNALAGYVRARPGATFLIGLAVVVGVPLAVILLCLTVVGIPAAAITAALYLILWWTARAVAGVVLGRLLLVNLFKVKETPVLFAALVGIVPLVLLGNIPIFKYILGVAVAAVAFGAWATYLARVRGYDPSPGTG